MTANILPCHTSKVMHFEGKYQTPSCILQVSKLTASPLGKGAPAKEKSMPGRKGNNQTKKILGM